MLVIVSILINNILIEDDQIVVFLILSIFASSFITSVISIIQFYNLGFFLGYIAGNHSSRYSGHLGQPNHMGTLMLMGFYASLYVYKKYQCSVVLFLLPLIVFAMVLTQSRTIWMFFIISIVVLVLKWNFFNKNIRNIIVLLPFFYALINQLLKLFTNSGVDAGQRIQVDAARVKLWYDFFRILPDFNILGGGFENIGRDHFLYGISFNHSIISYHNIVMDMYAIYGLLGLVFCGYVFIKLINILFRIQDESHIIIYMIVVAILNHAMFEFPLYYAYFLLPLIVILNYFDTLYTNGSYFDIKLNKNFLSFIFFVFIAFLVKYIQFVEENWQYYRSVTLGYCVENNKKYILFDAFENLGFINCKENINIKNLELFEKGFLIKPNRSNIKRLIYVYHVLGLVEKRDRLLAHFNKKFKLSLTIEDIEKIKY
ncbi:hypothetical protein HLH12_04460 [Acinetobacter sp. NIPH 2377]|uniref:PglL family O-oligosaccharyltransferase n=1 Tax=Acinetobacter terrestris TaxID=2529843 RepID=UPI00148F491F|nr:O-antigen ligase family protein [Acinetobacter terrestris]NNH34828.1 hypothetical protein [Acinetobacter terrestris]